MTTFSQKSFVDKLQKLSDSQQSIQTLSHWVQFHKKACADSGAVWAREALRATPSRQLLFVYLANDIMQNSKRKGDEFCNAYGTQLRSALPKIFVAASAGVQGKLLRILGIWEERRILDSGLINEMRARMTEGVASSGRVSSSTAISAPPPAPVPAAPLRPPAPAVDPMDDDDDEEDGYVPAMGAASATPLSRRESGISEDFRTGGPTVPLADLLVSLDQGSLVDELLAEQEADIDMGAISATGGSAKAGAAVELLSSHHAKLTDELAARRKLILLLAASVEEQHKQCTALTAAIKGCDEMLQTARKASAAE